jgi:hypothetical protein
LLEDVELLVEVELLFEVFVFVFDADITGDVFVVVVGGTRQT